MPAKTARILALSCATEVFRGPAILSTSGFEPDSQQPADATGSKCVAISSAVQRKLSCDVSLVVQSNESCRLSFRMPCGLLFQLRCPACFFEVCECIARSGRERLCSCSEPGAPQPRRHICLEQVEHVRCIHRGVLQHHQLIRAVKCNSVTGIVLL